MQNLATLCFSRFRDTLVYIRTENGSCDHDHSPFKDGLPSLG